MPALTLPVVALLWVGWPSGSNANGQDTPTEGISEAFVRYWSRQRRFCCSRKSVFRCHPALTGLSMPGAPVNCGPSYCSFQA